MDRVNNLIKYGRILIVITAVWLAGNIFLAGLLHSITSYVVVCASVVMLIVQYVCVAKLRRWRE